MPYRQDPFIGNYIGEGIFENSAALVAVDYLDGLAGLDKLEGLAKPTPTTSSDGAKIIYTLLAGKTDGKSVDRLAPTTSDGGRKVNFSLYADRCSSAEARELVRDHLDSGVLHKLTAKMVANFFNPISVDDYTCWGFVPLILGACAMSLGCRTLYTAPGYKAWFHTYKEMLIGIYIEVPLMDAAREQMRKALLGPDGFEPGTPIKFERFARPKDYVPVADEDSTMALMVGGAPWDYKPKWQKGIDDGFITHAVCPNLKTDLGYSTDETLCGGCGTCHAKPLICSKCRDQVYCSKACQKKDFGRHRACCRTPEDAKAFKKADEADPEKWLNRFRTHKEWLYSPAFSPVDQVAKVKSRVKMAETLLGKK
jgi:hypothetical protein